MIKEMLKRAAVDGKQRISVSDLQPKQYRWILAIDPNCSLTDKSQNKSGVCLLDTKTKDMWLYFLSFPELIEKFDLVQERFNPDELLIVIEGGWLNKSNWHLTRTSSAQKAAEMGRDVGRNHQTGILLAEMAEYLGLYVEVVKPLTKRWQGKDGKITHNELSVFVKNLPAHSNQDQRDAVLLAYNRAGFPLFEDPKAEYQRLMHG